MHWEIDYKPISAKIATEISCVKAVLISAAGGYKLKIAPSNRDSKPIIPSRIEKVPFERKPRRKMQK